MVTASDGESDDRGTACVVGVENEALSSNSKVSTMSAPAGCRGPLASGNTGEPRGSDGAASGGVAKEQGPHFEDGGLFDRIYRPGR